MRYSSIWLRRLLSATRLAGAPCFPVCAPGGEGVEALRHYLHRAAQAWRAPLRQEHFRLAVDRSFTLAGLGTVVTGTVFGGQVRLGVGAGGVANLLRRYGGGKEAAGVAAVYANRSGGRGSDSHHGQP